MGLMLAGLISITRECSTIGTDLRGVSVSIFLAFFGAAGRQDLVQWSLKIFGDQVQAQNRVRSCESGFWRSGPARWQPFAVTNTCWEAG
jgi:hypothetical protein